VPYEPLQNPHRSSGAGFLFRKIGICCGLFCYREGGGSGEEEEEWKIKSLNPNP
jgi:hypothetical protein